MNIRQFLKQSGDNDARLLQARIKTKIYNDLRAELKKNNVTIQAFMEAAALSYLSDAEVEMTYRCCKCDKPQADEGVWVKYKRNDCKVCRSCSKNLPKVAV